ncbi:ABC transporter permease [Anaerotalea alkaliphila]|uniref:ABC transporter permease subunit n=1 Tax=Anaerotalea alkaliphila TaxID=2662126 RepID=A0A7X5KLW2_9FIRM|nr:ABC transporter permease subunit [Anaerotalea alkaliphila]NDL67291.1 ABC transporter permease subunit [Anaerotalea alkaliphila]
MPTRIIPLLFWFLLWELAAAWMGKPLLLPSASQTLATLVRLLPTAGFWTTIAYSILRVLGGFLLAAFLGTLTGVACGFNRFLEALFRPMVAAVRSTPVLSFILLALLWFPSGQVPVFIAFLMCYPLFWTAVVGGMGQVDRKLLEMAHIYKVRRRDVLAGIYLPTLEPFLRGALVNGLGLGWKVAVAAEVLSRPRHAIGANLHDAKIYLETEGLFAWTLVVVGLSILFEVLFKKALSLGKTAGAKGGAS